MASGDETDLLKQKNLTASAIRKITGAGVGAGVGGGVGMGVGFFCFGKIKQNNTKHRATQNLRRRSWRWRWRRRFRRLRDDAMRRLGSDSRGNVSTNQGSWSRRRRCRGILCNRCVVGLLRDRQLLLRDHQTDISELQHLVLHQRQRG